MKNYFWVINIIIILLISCKEPIKEKIDLPPQFIQYHTLEEVQDAAARYGLENVIQEKTNNGLMYLSDSELEAFLKKEKENRDATKEMEAYFYQTKDVHSFDDFITLLNALPNARRLWVDTKGGEVNFQKWVDEQRKINWHIYRDEHGVLTWVHPEDDHGTEQGTRMDKGK